MQHTSHSPVTTRPSSLSHHSLSSNYHSNHYGSVKVEDDHYSVRARAVYFASRRSLLPSSHQTIIIIMDRLAIITPLSLHLPKLYPMLMWITGMPTRPNVHRCIGRAEITSNPVFFSWLIDVDDTPPVLLLSLSLAAFRLAVFAASLFSPAIIESIPRPPRLLIL